MENEGNVAKDESILASIDESYTDYDSNDYKETLLDYMLCGCRLQFRFLSESLIFTPNPGLYMAMSMCSLLNAHILLLYYTMGLYP